MYKDIRLHGVTDEQIEYCAIAAGIHPQQIYLFTTVGDEGNELRFFSPGNEFVLGREGISYRGNGGSFCEYMFAVDQPAADIQKGDILNRLVMYGASYQDGGALVFGDNVDGRQSYDRIFFEGNAICNYFFFVNSTKISGSIKKQQKELVRLFGKAIKRSGAVGHENEAVLIDELVALLDDPKGQIFLFKLINRRHKEYYDLFRSLYFKSKKIPDAEFAGLTSLATCYGLDRYQQERIRIDVMYRHPDNKRIVDEYRSILIDCHRKGRIDSLENARLTRLKTLSVRNKIPGALFNTLDEMLKKDKKMADPEESDYLSETREILAGLFLHEHTIQSTINREDMIRLLYARKKAAENRDHGFEEILLQVSKACDERIRDGADISLTEGFYSIITLFDRFETTSLVINQLAFMENVRISEVLLRNLLSNRQEFEKLRRGLFEEIFIDGLMENKYLGNYGRKKVTILVRGLTFIEENHLTIGGLLDQLLEVDHEERLFIVLLSHVRERIRNFYSKYATQADQETLKREVAEELKHKKLLQGDVPEHLFLETILTIKKEAVYLHNLLPKIIQERNVGLREDFLENSGLDRFYVEELEREYYELNDLPIDGLYHIRKGLS